MITIDSKSISTELTDAQFDAIRTMLYRLCGIHLSSGKEQLVKSRLMKRLRTLGLYNFREYLSHLENDASGGELIYMIDALATNKTDFFREMQHFEYLRRHILPEMRGDSMRFWSAGCSSGEEPFSLAIVLREEITDIDRKDIRILATDISTKMLKIAAEAVYSREVLDDVPKTILNKCFAVVPGSSPLLYRVNDAVRYLVRFARLNLMDSWPMHGPFDMIFCRNVMIYFDDETRRMLIHRFYNVLRPGGYLFVGHSESLAALTHEFHYVQPAIYRK